MTLTPRLGLCFPPTLAPERLRPAVRAAEDAGLDEFWLWEDCFKESGIASSAAALGWTERIRVGLGLMPVPLRNVALTAMEIATLDRLFPGRFLPGIGHGVQDWMRQVGEAVESPMTLLREHEQALRLLLAGQRVTVQGRYVQLDDVVLDWPPLAPPPLLLGGAGPRSLRLSGELGDGVLLSSGIHNHEQLAEKIAIAREGVAQRTPEGVAQGIRPSGPLDLYLTVVVATGTGGQSRVDAEVAEWGDGLGVAGDAAAIADEVQTLGAAGLTCVVIQPTRDEPDLEGLIRVLGQARQLVQRT
jgi:alkanesulfonate monooxygenase SsuD/methylene tetrahydromethanopterin reductase-like flavin-dependent oxidoreductase (luciferase family)